MGRLGELLRSLSLDRGVHNFIFLGEAGCGKSEIAINFALALLAEGDKPVHFYDLDMTKPLFRSRDQAAFLEERGVHFHFEEQFYDAPTVVGGVNRLLRDNSVYTVLDVGGDFIGARSVGGYAPLLNAPGTVVWYVVNPYRPWSLDIDHVDRVLGEVLGVSHVRIDRLRLLGNPNLGPETTAEEVLAGAERTIEMVGEYKDVDFFTAREDLADALEGKYPVLPMKMYLTYEWEK